jgi:serine/threonine-protein kinase
MRRISLPIDVTPEGTSVRQFELVPTGDHLALVYWEDGGKEPGVYARMLDLEGKIETGLRKLSSGRKGDYYPALAIMPSGEFWAVWEEEIEGNVSDLVARRLGPDLEPKANAVRLTAFRPPSGPARQPRTPSAVIDRNQLIVAFAKDLGGQRIQVMLQTIPLDDPALQTGIAFKVGKGVRPPRKNDEVLGTMKSVSPASSRNAQPRLTCNDAGCFVAWDDEKAGALMAFVDRERGPLWHREFGNKGASPALAQDERGLVVTWFEGARLKLAPIARDGIGTASLISRVSGIQPPPDVARGKKPGEWYVAFRDFESAHHEVFALRAECP